MFADYANYDSTVVNSCKIYAMGYFPTILSISKRLPVQIRLAIYVAVA